MSMNLWTGGWDLTGKKSDMILFNTPKPSKRFTLKKEIVKLITTTCLHLSAGYDQFSSTRLSEELSKYLQIVKDERVVFIFDEASEAIGQKKFTLLDLEGVSESLTSLGNKVWTIAIAQQRLDEVISNSGLNKAQLTKVTDRFKTKIHLESTEVDIIIKNRLLKKTDEGLKALSDNYDNHSGLLPSMLH